MSYHYRIIEKKLTAYLQFFSVVGLTGPRQSGKSTLLLKQLPGYRYINFDDIRFVQAFYDDPQKFMRLYDNKVIFDEVQKVPELFNYIKIAVDQDRDTCGKFILTGSSRFSMIRHLADSLAGRIGLLSLLPYQFSELPAHSRELALLHGSYPELVNKGYQLSQDWYAAYIDTYLNTDLKALIHIGDMRDFMRFIQLLAANTAQLLNLSHYARDLGVDVKTIKRWVGVLEGSYIIFLLSPYYSNRGKRITKSPKVYFYDNGLVNYLVGIETIAHLENGPMAGALFENYVVSDIYKKVLHTGSHTKLYHYRTQHGVEVDLIMEQAQQKTLIEIKHSETYHPRMIKPINSLYADGDKAYLLYRGQALSAAEQVEIINYQDYLLR